MMPRDMNGCVAFEAFHSMNWTSSSGDGGTDYAVNYLFREHQGNNRHVYGMGMFPFAQSHTVAALTSARFLARAEYDDKVHGRTNINKPVVRSEAYALFRHGDDMCRSVLQQEIEAIGAGIGKDCPGIIECLVPAGDPVLPKQPLELLWQEHVRQSTIPYDYNQRRRELSHIFENGLLRRHLDYWRERCPEPLM